MHHADLGHYVQEHQEIELAFLAMRFDGSKIYHLCNELALNLAKQACTCIKPGML